MSGSSSSMAPPVRFIYGIFQWVLGIAICIPASVMKVFPVTSIFGGPLLGMAMKLSFHGGSNIVRGIGGTFGMMFRSKKSAE